MTSTVAVSRKWRPDERLQPWVVYDLDRIAWIVEARAGELTAQERTLVRDAAAWLARAVEPGRS